MWEKKWGVGSLLAIVVDMLYSWREYLPVDLRYDDNLLFLGVCFTFTIQKKKPSTNKRLDEG